ncbi:hypothetical protein L1887_30749 [Cichorium endivia]|nr:hypothetical protein L1887_30749 [Cichorium endivia]
MKRKLDSSMVFGRNLSGKKIASAYTEDKIVILKNKDNSISIRNMINLDDNSNVDIYHYNKIFKALEFQACSAGALALDLYGELEDKFLTML